MTAEGHRADQCFVPIHGRSSILPLYVEQYLTLPRMSQLRAACCTLLSDLNPTAKPAETLSGVLCQTDEIGENLTGWDDRG